MTSLIHEIEAFMQTHRMPPTVFGQEALGDKHFVRQLRSGRDPKMSTAEKVRAFMRDYTPSERAA